MFFPRMRRHAKWMFVLLALVFGLGFVLFGVGAGGVGVGELFRGDGSSGGDSASIADARDRTQENPKDAEAWRDLASAYQLENRTEDSITALERYTVLQPKDTDALRELAGLYIAQASLEQRRAQEAQVVASVSGSGLFSNPLELGGRQTIGTPPISQALQEQATQVANEAFAAAQTAITSALDAYRRLAAADPNDASIQLELAQTAQSVGQTAVAIAAYQRFLKLAPDDPSAELVRQQIKQLQQTTQPDAG